MSQDMHILSALNKIQPHGMSISKKILAHLRIQILRERRKTRVEKVERLIGSRAYYEIKKEQTLMEHKRYCNLSSYCESVYNCVNGLLNIAPIIVVEYFDAETKEEHSIVMFRIQDSLSTDISIRNIAHMWPLRIIRAIDAVF